MSIIVCYDVCDDGAVCANDESNRNSMLPHLPIIEPTVPVVCAPLIIVGAFDVKLVGHLNYLV